MRTKLMIATAAVATLLAGAAFAQSDTAVNPSALPAGVATGNAVDGPKPATGADITAPIGSDATVAPAAGAPAESVSAASVGGTDLVSSGPVPDTRANRAKYGQPMSNAGRMTKPAGN